MSFFFLILKILRFVDQKREKQAEVFGKCKLDIFFPVKFVGKIVNIKRVVIKAKMRIPNDCLGYPDIFVKVPCIVTSNGY